MNTLCVLCARRRDLLERWMTGKLLTTGTCLGCGCVSAVAHGDWPREPVSIATMVDDLEAVIIPALVKAADESMNPLRGSDEATAALYMKAGHLDFALAHLKAAL